MSRMAGPSREELERLDDAELEHLAVEWRARASRGAREAYGVAHALEAERRRRLRARSLPHVPPQLPRPARPWWKFWQGLGGGSGPSA